MQLEQISGGKQEGQDLKKLDTLRLEGSWKQKKLKKENYSGLNTCVELMILIFQKWYMNGNWRGEDKEDNNQCLGNRTYIRLPEILTLQLRKFTIETDGRLSSVERETND